MVIPYYGFDRKVGKEAAKRMLKKIARFDRMITGHYHAPLQHPLYWIGGSLQGTDAYDHSQGRYADPIQSAWDEIAPCGYYKFRFMKEPRRRDYDSCS